MVKGNEVSEILKYPLSTEKAVRAIESDNTLVFAVDKSANKVQIKWAIQKEYSVKVLNVRTMIDMKGVKKAYVKLDHSTPAIDVTSKLGLI